MVLATNSVDAGTTFDLHDIAGRPTFAISATGVFRSWQYEDSQLRKILLILPEHYYLILMLKVTDVG